MINLVVAGSNGRMGQQIIEMAKKDTKNFSKVVGFDKENDPKVITQGDVLIDFTIPLATVEHLKIAQGSGKPLVIGTTGFSDEEKVLLQKASQSIAIVQSSNMSRGMNVMFNEVRRIAKFLQPKRVEITETHHVHKKDSPSGSALTLRDYILDPKSSWSGDVPIYSLREGEVVGEHKVLEDGWDEEIEIIHRARSRAPFAAGALLAAIWLMKEKPKPGIYSMQDVLKLND